VGSAVNDTTRELGGTLGVAVIGSVFNSIYIGALSEGRIFGLLPAEAQRATEDTVAAAPIVADRMPEQFVSAYLAEVSDAFLAGLAVACLVAAGVAFAGALFAARFLPARAASEAAAADLSPAGHSNSGSAAHRGPTLT
jgi:hypothetical protein